MTWYYWYLGVYPIIVLEENHHCIGGASFVQLVTALNLGLFSIAQLTKSVESLLSSIRRERERLIAEANAKVAEMEAKECDPLRVSEAKIAVNKLQKYLKEQHEPASESSQRKIWTLCRILTAVCFFLGLLLLYFDEFYVWDWILGIPYIAYWVLSWITVIRYCYKSKTESSAYMKINLHSTLVEPKSPNSEIKDVISKIEGTSGNLTRRFHWSET